MAWGDFFGTSWDDPKTMMMMQMAAGLLSGNPVGQNRATLGQSLSRGLLGGMQGYQQGMQAKRQGEMLDLKKREADLRDQQLQAELEAKRQEQARQQQQMMLRGALPGLLGGQPMSGPQAMALGATQGNVGPTRANAAHMTPSPGGMSQQFLQAALASGMKIDDIKTLAGAQQWNTPKVSKFENVRNADGSVSVMGFDEFGRPVQTGLTPYVDPKFMNLGSTQVAIDPITQQTLGRWQNSMSPGEAASNRLGWANYGNSRDRLAMERQRFNADQAQRNQPIWSAEHGGFVSRPGPNGQAPTFTPVTGQDGKPISANKPPTEFQASSAGYAVRMAEANKVMNTIGSSGQASTWNSLTGSVPMVGDYLQRNLSSKDRQQVKQAEDDWIRAKLRRESGAVIAAEEMEAERRTYFPMPGDGPEVVAQKSRARQIAEESMTVNAGPAFGAVNERVAAIPGAASRGATGGWEQHYESQGAAVKDARNALMRGANKAEVIRRLEAMGITNHGIR